MANEASENAPAPTAPPPQDEAAAEALVDDAVKRPREYGGPKGLEPTRYGDWERKGRCVDF
jgi:hypothetical protein